MGNSARKIAGWKRQDAPILDLTSRTKWEEVQTIKLIFAEHGFPDGELLFRSAGEEYSDVCRKSLARYDH